MGLIIHKKTNLGGLTCDKGSYMQLKPFLTYGLKNIPVDRAIFACKEEYDALSNKTVQNLVSPATDDAEAVYEYVTVEVQMERGTIDKLDQVRDCFYVNPEDAPATKTGTNVVTKMLRWIHEEVKAQILADNPTWADADIEIDL